MGAHNGTVDHGIFVVGVCCGSLEHPLLDTALDPTAEPPVQLYPLTEPRRQIAPRHRDCRKIGGQAAIAISGRGSLAAWNFCPNAEPSVLL